MTKHQILDFLYTQISQLKPVDTVDDVLEMTVEDAFVDALKVTGVDITGVSVNLYGECNMFDCDGELKLEYWFKPNQILNAKQIIEIFHELGHLAHYRIVGDLYELQPKFFEQMSMRFESECIKHYGINLSNSRDKEFRRFLAVALVDQLYDDGDDFFDLVKYAAMLCETPLYERDFYHIFDYGYRKIFYTYPYWMWFYSE